MSKCELGKTTLVYLGHIVGHGQLKIDPSKVEAIVNWPKPTSVTKVHSLLGVVHYWRRFIVNFSIIAAPLHTLISVKKVFQWGGKQQKFFEALKEKISTHTGVGLTRSLAAIRDRDRCHEYCMEVVLM